MRRCVIVIFFIILIIGIFTKVSFAQGIVNLKADSEHIQKGDIVTITIDFQGIQSAALTTKLYYDKSKLEYIEDVDNSNLSEGRILYTWVDNMGKNRSQENGLVANFKFRAIEEGSALFGIEGEIYDEQGNEVLTKWEGTKVQIGNKEIDQVKEDKVDIEETDAGVDSAYLKTMRLNLEGVVPEFEKTITDYYITIPTSVYNIPVIAEAENSNATIQISGNENLIQGNNTIQIKVTSADKNNTSIYQIHVTKTETPELANSNLETLAIENEIIFPSFDTNYTKYTTSISSDKSSINLLAIPEDQNATAEINGTDNLKFGNNIIQIDVTAANGFTKKRYVVQVYRRNEEEDKKYEDEQKYETEKLEALLEQSEERNQNEIDEQKPEKKENKQKARVWGIGVIIIIAFIVFVVVMILRKYRI